MKQWWIYKGTGEPHDEVNELPAPPSWRAFGDHDGDGDDRMERRGENFIIDDPEIDLVNMALFLRRPLLVTGAPGTGKSSLAYAVRYELKLGRVLYWPINSRSTLREGLYGYDAIGRLQETSVQQAGTPTAPSEASEHRAGPPDIGPYITLGPLGTALLPSDRPRVLLVDEIDKGDIDLPNDLLNVFEEGRFTIPELARLAEVRPEVKVNTADPDVDAVITAGRVRCRAFPFVVLTSNGERDFPPPFLRRCIQLELKPPGKDKLIQIVEAHLKLEARRQPENLVAEFVRRRDEENRLLATDQLLNSVYILTLGRGPGKDPNERDKLLDTLWRSLSEPGGG